MTCRIGFIGAGGIAGRHMANLAGFEDVAIVAIADPAAERAAEAASRCGARAYADHRAMLDAEKLDACYVCMPPFAHGAPEHDLHRPRSAVFRRKAPGRRRRDRRGHRRPGRAGRARHRGGLSLALSRHHRGSPERLAARPGPARHRILARLHAAARLVDRGPIGGPDCRADDPYPRSRPPAGGRGGGGLRLRGPHARRRLSGVRRREASTAVAALPTGAVGSISSTCLLRWPHRIGLNLFCDGMAIELTEFDIMVDVGQGRPGARRRRAILSCARIGTSSTPCGAREPHPRALRRSVADAPPRDRAARSAARGRPDPPAKPAPTAARV